MKHKLTQSTGQTQTAVRNSLLPHVVLLMTLRGVKCSEMQPCGCMILEEASVKGGQPNYQIKHECTYVCIFQVSTTMNFSSCTCTCAEKDKIPIPASYTVMYIHIIRL